MNTVLDGVRVDVLASHMRDAGQSTPTGLTLTVVLLVAIVFLVRSMSKHLKRIPTSFGPAEPVEEVPDDASELFEPKPGDQLLDELRKAPLAIEPPRRDDRPDSPHGS